MDVSNFVKRINDRSSFNQWLGIQVVEVAIGSVSLKIQWREDFGQYSGHLHAVSIIVPIIPA